MLNFLSEHAGKTKYVWMRHRNVYRELRYHLAWRTKETAQFLAGDHQKQTSATEWPCFSLHLRVTRRRQPRASPRSTNADAGEGTML